MRASVGGRLDLVRETRRLLPWRMLSLAALAALVMVALPAALRLHLHLANIVLLTRFAGLTAALGCAFIFDDPATPTTLILPTPMLIRHAARLVWLVPAAAGWWAATLLIASTVTHPLPVRGLTIEATAMLALTVAAAAVGVAIAPNGVAGLFVAPLVLAAVVAVLSLPVGGRLLIQPDDPRWTATHRDWAMLTAAALVVTAATTVDVRHRLAGRTRDRRGTQ